MKKTIAIMAACLLACAGGYFLGSLTPPPERLTNLSEGGVLPNTPVWVYSMAEQWTEAFLRQQCPDAHMDIDLHPGGGYTITLSGDIPKGLMEVVNQHFLSELNNNLKEATSASDTHDSVLSGQEQLMSTLSKTNSLSNNANVHRGASEITTTSTNWHGVYTSPSEIGGFSRTVIAILCQRDGSIWYRRQFRSDVFDLSKIPQKEQSGVCLVDGDKLYVPEATGKYEKGKLILQAHLTRYTRMVINGRPVLIRDDALKVFKENDKLYDYGIMIKADDYADRIMDISTTPHISIKTLYRDKSGSWQDPFVNGPNKR